jgi:hypothetical protein
MWTVAFGHHEDRTSTHGYEPTREAAMAAFGKSWRREWAAQADDETQRAGPVILFCVGTGIDHAAVGILAHVS